MRRPVISSRSIDVSTGINQYFDEVVGHAVQRLSVDTTEAARHYLVELLCDYARPGAAAATALDKPLTLLLRDALEAAGAERFERLRRIGDGILYALGFFGESVTRRGADRDYVVTLGSSAYGHAAAMLRRPALGRGSPGSHGPDVLSELAHKYDAFVGVVSEVADVSLANAAATDTARAVRLYERWVESGSPHLAVHLCEIGLFPTPPAEGLH